MSTISLEVALDGLGIRCSVEAYDRLAIIIPRGAVDGLEGAALRRDVLRLAREHGFTHIALELETPPAVEPGESRDAASPAFPRAPVHRD